MTAPMRDGEITVVAHTYCGYVCDKVRYTWRGDNFKSGIENKP